MALKIVRRYDANGRELTEKDLETFRLDSPVVRKILANLNREVAEGIREREKKVTIEDVIKNQYCHWHLCYSGSGWYPPS